MTDWKRIRELAKQAATNPWRGCGEDLRKSGYNDLISTSAEQKAFEDRCFERFDKITKEPNYDDLMLKGMPGVTLSEGRPMRRLKKMDANLLKYFIALQPFFRERMGEWQPGDRCCDQQGNLGLVIVPPPHCKDKKVVWVMWFEKNGSFAYQDGYEANDPEIYYLPRTIDDSSEEARRRSLWGMCKDIICLNDNGKDGFEVCILLNEGRGETWDERSYKGTTPTETILKALCAQWKE